MTRQIAAMWQPFLLSAVLVAGACAAPAQTSSPATPTPQPTAEPSLQPSSAFERTSCPAAVADVMIVVPSCGYLTVPERHEQADGRQVRIFVARIDPSEGIEAPDPMVAVGETLGGEIEYGGLSILAQRTGRAIYIVDRRGTGQSTPSLDCPELDAGNAEALAFPANHDRARASLLHAVAACRARLNAEGTDVDAYGLTQSALDVAALRRALEIPVWNVIAFGSASRLALEVGRMAPDGVRTIVLDSPVLPQGPDPMFNVEATDRSIMHLNSLCSADPECSLLHPDPSEEIAAAVDHLAGEPVELEIDAGGGSKARVVLDDTQFARAVRQLLATDGGREIVDILPAVVAIREGTLQGDEYLVRRVIADGDLCLGYVPDCSRIVYGSLLTTFCADTLPYSDEAGAWAQTNRTAVLAKVFASNPFQDVCSAWDVHASDPTVATAMTSAIPVLVMNGEFDPYTGPLDSMRATSGLTSASFIEVPNQSYNVFGFNECPRSVRREWLDAPGATLDTSCFEDIPALSPLR